MFGPDEEDQLECFERIEIHVVDNMSQTLRRRQLEACQAADPVLQDNGSAEAEIGPAEVGIRFHQCQALRRYKT